MTASGGRILFQHPGDKQQIVWWLLEAKAFASVSRESHLQR